MSQYQLSCSHQAELTYKVTIQNKQEFRFYEDLKRRSDDYDVIIDRPIRKFNETFVFRSKDCMIPKVVDLLKRHQISLYKIENSPKLQRNWIPVTRLSKQNYFSFDVINTQYLNNEDINKYGYTLAEKIISMYPRLDVRYTTEGYTYEGLPINSISIGYKGKQNPVVVIDAGIHAREWHSRNVALNILYQLGKEADLGGLLNNISFIIIPNLNPDGYRYSCHYDKDWRKNRRPVYYGCYGVDGNRNYDIEWSLGEQEKNPCEPIYKGLEPFSEVETQIVRNILTKYQDQCFLYISIHTFGNKIIYPPGYSTQPHPRKRYLHRVATAGVKAVRARTGTRFSADQSGTGLYVAAGGSDDYAMDVLGIPFAYTFESGLEELGFIVPPKYLKKTNLEGWIAIKAMIKEAYYLRNLRYYVSSGEDDEA
ncbi:carboxypeptidase B-like [Chironomus tepperi]|uniref:carboxypeptidase B-like n=1 Tax=Chironomus tepperi TaxID=113505 RepID=UPI00391F5513